MTGQAQAGSMTAGRVGPLTDQAGLGAVVSLTPLAAGGNNRVYRLICTGGAALLKEYFRDPGGRDRLGSEVAFATYAAARGLSVPRPLADDAVAGLGLYEFIDGRGLVPNEVTWPYLAQALDFLARLNTERSGAGALPEGAEACFTPKAHLEVVDRRIARLLSADPAAGDAGAGVAREAALFLQAELVPAWERVRHMAEARLADMAGLEPAQRMVSPSDFGFHNTLLTEHGRLCFFDFEYAGWDDPAKAVCDFFCQPALPVPREDLGRFVAGLAEASWTDAGFARRVEVLLPVYEIKWVTILLNEFLPEGLRRRMFADGADPDHKRSVQLDKARRALAKIC